MPFNLFIQTFNGLHASHQVDEPNAAIYWAANRIWFTQAGGDAGFVTRYNFNTGVEKAFATKGSILSGVAGGAGALGFDTDGNIYASGPNALGNGSLTKINGDTLKLISNTAYPAHFGGYNILTQKIGAKHYILDLDAGGGIGALGNTQLTAGTVFSVSYDWPNVDGAQICMGKDGTGYAYMFSAAGAGVCKFQKLNLWPGTSTDLHTFIPTDIDAGWTEINVSGMCLDQTDGNVIVSVYTNSGSNRNYLLKLSVTTGAIIWKLLLPGATDQGIGQNHLSQSRIVHQTLYIFSRGPVQTIYTIDTNAGAITNSQTTGMAGFTAHIQQASDDVRGVICGYCDFTPTGGGPTPLRGSTGPFSGWYWMQVAPAMSPPIGESVPGDDEVEPYVPPIIIPPVRQLPLFSRTPWIEYQVSASDSVSVFPVPFSVMEQADIQVEVNSVLIAQNAFTYVGRDNQMAGHETGYVSLNAAASNCIVRIWADRTPMRTTDFADGEFEKEGANTELEKLWIIDRCQHLKQMRTLDDPQTGSIPLPAAYAGMRQWVQGTCAATRNGSDQIYMGATSGSVLMGTGTNSLAELVCTKKGIWFVRTKSGSWSLA